MGGCFSTTSLAANERSLLVIEMNNKHDSLLFDLLKARGLAVSWANHHDPRAGLIAECEILGSDSEFLIELKSYLAKNPVILQSLDTVLAQLAFSAGVHWQQASETLQPLARRGWHLSRWLPTFLVIDGPLGRLLRDTNSPLAKTLKTTRGAYPLLSSARDLFNNDFFRRIRNGFAHWSFTWQDQGNTAQISIINWDSGAQEAEMTLLEAEALHFISASIIQVIDQSLLRKAVGG
jgi:hypothetical protein